MTTISITGDSNDTDLILGSQSGSITENSNIPSTTTLENKVDELKTLLLSHSSLRNDSSNNDYINDPSNSLVDSTIIGRNPNYLYDTYTHKSLNDRFGPGDYFFNPGMINSKNITNLLNAFYDEVKQGIAPGDEAWYGIPAEYITEYGRNRLASCGINDSGYNKVRDGASTLTTTNVPTDIYQNFGVINKGNLFYTDLRLEVGKMIKAFSGDLYIGSSTTDLMNKILNAFPWRNNDRFIAPTFHWAVDLYLIEGCLHRLKAYGVDVDYIEPYAPPPLTSSVDDYVQFYKDQIKATLDAGRRPRMIQIDHVHWATAIKSPVNIIAREVKAYIAQLITDGSYSNIIDASFVGPTGLIVMVDGAHSFGSVELDFNNEYSDVDIFIAPFHKRIQATGGLAFAYAKNAYKNELGLFWFGGYDYATFNYSPQHLGLVGGDAMMTESSAFNATPNNFAARCALSAFNQINLLGGPQYFANLGFEKYKSLGSKLIQNYGYQSLISSWVTINGEVGNISGSNLDNRLIGDTIIACPGNIIDVKPRMPVGKTNGVIQYVTLEPGQTYTDAGGNTYTVGHDSLWSLVFWDKDDPSGNYQAGDVVTQQEKRGISDASGYCPMPYMRSFGNMSDTCSWGQKLWVLCVKNNIMTRAVNSKYRISSRSDISGIVWGDDGHGGTRRSSGLRFSMDKQTTLDDINNMVPILNGLVNDLTQSYNGDRSLFNSQIFSGVYNYKAKRDSYMFSWRTPPRSTTSVTENSNTVYVNDYLPDGCDKFVDPTALYKHSSGPRIVPSDVESNLTIRRYYTNESEWDKSTGRLR